MEGPALAYSGGGNTGYATIEMSRAMRAALTSGRARYCTPRRRRTLSSQGRNAKCLRPYRDRWERRLDVTLPPKKSVTSVLEKADTIDYYCRER